MNLLDALTAPPADGLPADAPRGRRAELILAGEILAALRHNQQTMTVFISRLAGRVVNDVLEVATRAFDASATPIVLRYGSPIGCVEINNTSGHAITVMAGVSAGLVPPAVGIGVYVVPAGARVPVNIAAAELTLYGTAADSFSYQVFAAGSLATSGLVGIDGGIG